MHDSGKRQSFSTGAMRDTAEDKPRIDLVSPFAERRLGHWLREGAKKYRERNWEAGIPISRCVASLARHINAYRAGEKDEDHMAAVMCNAMFIMHYEAMIARGTLAAELADMPDYSPRKPRHEKAKAQEPSVPGRAVAGQLRQRHRELPGREVMGAKSRRKGKVGEREAAATLNAVLGCNARRGVQYRGGPDSPDLVTDFPGLHFEVKRTERLKLWEALSQAETDAKGTVPVVLHRANNRPWVAIVRLADIGILSAILRSTHTPSLNLSGTSGDRPSVSVGSTDVGAGSR